MNSAYHFKMFTVEEANELIPALYELIQKLQSKKLDILRLEAEIDALELIGGISSGGKPGTLVAAELEIYESEVNEFYNIIDEIHQKGCLLKDVDTGLVDFYSVYNGRVVYLCWQIGEEEVLNWHEIGRGYAHRQPLRADHQSEK